MDTSQHPLGDPIPAYTEHAISVSLPKWEDNVMYEESDPRVVSRMQTGYPRFFIHKTIEKLAQVCVQKLGTPSESAILFPSAPIAEACRTFVAIRDVPARVVALTTPDGPKASASVFAVLLPTDKFSVGKQFWQHSGLGISSRRAEHCLALLVRNAPAPAPSPAVRVAGKTANKHYAAKPARGAALPSPTSPSTNGFPTAVDDMESEHATFLEERYGRNLNVCAVSEAKRALRRRIAGVLVRDDKGEVEVGVSVRGVAVQESDVYLYPTGMSTIWSAHQVALSTLGERKSICFGFPYTDTLKILEKWGPGCHFLGFGLDESIDELEQILAEEKSKNPDVPPALALFTEFPSNPLLRSANLPRLRALADKYDFLIVVDDTIGNFVNVEALPYTDIMVTSLSKIFSGDANVMGGSLVLNPAGKHYATLKSYLDSTYEDIYFDEDAIFMERNSRDFQRRIRTIDDNTLAVCAYLHAVSRAHAASSPLTRVFYPKYETTANYDACRVAGGGYGGLFSLDFVSADASRAFFDALPCYKGPSLGTNFTLACPYTILGHYAELPWAAGYGVHPTLVRVSVGLEERAWLLDAFKTAFEAAQAVVAT
ncbi:PLP-dependent transferase [Amylostereum chailletii]|nr:PLP-dependent transferase [Amylostereum chailletii]